MPGERSRRYLHRMDPAGFRSDGQRRRRRAARHGCALLSAAFTGTGPDRVAAALDDLAAECADIAPRRGLAPVRVEHFAGNVPSTRTGATRSSTSARAWSGDADHPVAVIAMAMAGGGPLVGIGIPRTSWSVTPSIPCSRSFRGGLRLDVEARSLFEGLTRGQVRYDERYLDPTPTGHPDPDAEQPEGRLCRSVRSGPPRPVMGRAGSESPHPRRRDRHRLSQPIWARMGMIDPTIKRASAR